MAKTKRPRTAPALPALKVPLEQIRERIDSVDAQLHALINERARLAQQVGVSKHAAGHTVDFYRPERESQVLRLALQRNQEEGGPLRDEEVLRLFREIMSACLAQQNALKIGYLGPEGTFTQQAVLKYFGHSVRPLPLTSVEEVFHEVESGAADFGVVPIENSTEGTVNNTLDMFLTSPLKIIGEVELRINAVDALADLLERHFDRSRRRDDLCCGRFGAGRRRRLLQCSTLLACRRGPGSLGLGHGSGRVDQISRAVNTPGMARSLPRTSGPIGESVSISV
jgi:chorismate mutase-like protein